jgi:hypothetical protein
MRGSQSSVDGKVYSNAPFGDLPALNAWFDTLRHVALQEAATIGAWFMHNGYCNSSRDLDSIFTRIMAISPRELEMAKK